MSTQNQTKTALVAVDVQNDFIDGALGGLDADQVDERNGVVAPIVQLSSFANLTVATRDWHPQDHVSFADEPRFEDKSWPKHCVQDTDGAAIHPDVLKVADLVVSKGTDKNVEQYSGAEGKTEDGKSLVELLRDNEIKRVIVTGLCTDYCVLGTARDLKAAGFDVEVPLDAVAGVAEDSSQAAIAEMAQLGIRVN